MSFAHVVRLDASGFLHGDTYIHTYTHHDKEEGTHVKLVLTQTGARIVLGQRRRWQGPRGSP